MSTPDLVSFECGAIFVLQGTGRDLEARKTRTTATVRRNGGNKTLARRAGATPERR